MNPETLPPVIDLVLTGRCNLACPFCWGPAHDTPSVNVRSLERVLRRLPRFGVRRVVITGGEPTLVSELGDLLACAREVGLEVVLSTNGLLLEEHFDALVPYVDWVGLPLDADNPEVNARMRPGDDRQYGCVLRVLGALRERTRIGIKLRTVVCRINRDAVAGIPALVARHARPDVWRVYQVVYASYGAIHRDQLEISDAEFTDVLRRLQAEADRYGIPLKPYQRSEDDGRHLFLQPNGDAVVHAAGASTTIGNFFSAIDEVAARWPGFIIDSRVQSHLADY